jgi:hypothetical protein
VNWACAPAHCSCDFMRAHAVRRLCDWAPRRLPFLTGFLFAEPICIVSWCFSARVGLARQVEVPGIHGKESYLRTYLYRMHTDQDFLLSYIPRNTYQYRPKNTNSGCNSTDMVSYW